MTEPVVHFTRVSKNTPLIYANPECGIADHLYLPLKRDCRNTTCGNCRRTLAWRKASREEKR